MLQSLKYTLCVFPPQLSAEKEKTTSNRLFESLIHFVTERQAEVNAAIDQKQRAEELRAEELIRELQLETTELQRRKTELKELETSEDHLHLLQVSLRLW